MSVPRLRPLSPICWSFIGSVGLRGSSGDVSLSDCDGTRQQEPCVSEETWFWPEAVRGLQGQLWDARGPRAPTAGPRQELEPRSPRHETASYRSTPESTPSTQHTAVCSLCAVWENCPTTCAWSGRHLPNGSRRRQRGLEGVTKRKRGLVKEKDTGQNDQL